MAMFVLVVDTSLMNVSISAVVEDLDTTVSGVQSAIALEALVSAAFILIGSKVGDLIGRKRAYVLGLLGYAIGALSMALAQSVTAIIIFWAIIGGLGASLLLPAMQSLIHGNFEGAARRKVYALVGAAAAIAAAVGPLIGGFITTYLSWRVAFLLEVVVIAIVLSGIELVRDVPYTGSRRVDVVGSVLSVAGHGRHRAGHPGVAGGRGVRRRAAGRSARSRWRRWSGGSCAASARASRRCSTPTCSSPSSSGSGSPGRCSSRSPWAATMIALPIYLQMVLEYNAMEAGLSLAPLSLSMFGVALLAGKKAGEPASEQHHPVGVRAPHRRAGGADPDRAPGRLRLVPRGPADHRRMRAGPAGVPAQQLHAVADLGGAGQRGRRRELGGGIVRAVVRAGVRRRHHARDALDRLHRHGRGQHRAPAGRAAAGRRRARGRRRGDDQHRSSTSCSPGNPTEIQDEIIRINTDARPLALQVALLIPILAGLLGLFLLVPHDAPPGPDTDRRRRRDGPGMDRQAGWRRTATSSAPNG